jgi:multidrug efflux pump subunit AcrB
MAHSGHHPDVVDVLREQSVIAPAGRSAASRRRRAAAQYTVHVRGRLGTPQEFGEVVLRTGTALVRLRDIARVSLDATDYGRSAARRAPIAMIGIYQLPDANALEVSRRVIGAETLSGLPRHPGRSFDTTRFIAESIHESR